MKTIRYHIELKSHRTTVSVDKIVSDLMAIKLGYSPDSPEARRAVRNRLGELARERKRDCGYHLGKYITEEAILDLADKMLSKKYLEWYINKLVRPKS